MIGLQRCKYVMFLTPIWSKICSRVSLSILKYSIFVRGNLEKGFSNQFFKVSKGCCLLFLWWNPSHFSFVLYAIKVNNAKHKYSWMNFAKRERSNTIFLYFLVLKLKITRTLHSFTTKIISSEFFRTNCSISFLNSESRISILFFFMCKRNRFCFGTWREFYKGKELFSYRRAWVSS